MAVLGGAVRQAGRVVCAGCARGVRGRAGVGGGGGGAVDRGGRRLARYQPARAGATASTAHCKRRGHREPMEHAALTSASA